MNTATHHPSASPNDPLEAVRQRLAQLEGYLRQDPTNARLLVDTFEAALACAQWERVEALLAQGRTQGDDAVGWALREGDYWLARHQFDRARDVLEQLQPQAAHLPGLDSVIAHNLAYIEWQQGHSGAAIERLKPYLEVTGPASLAQASDVTQRVLQVLWLRCLHTDGQLERALEWTRAHERPSMAQGEGTRVHPQALGVASLIALDAQALEDAQRWSSACLAVSSAQDAPVEALVTRASLALAARDLNRANHCIDQALRLRPGEGRSWSAKAFIELAAGQLPAAQVSFERAVQRMPAHIGTWHGKAWCELVQGQMDAAQASFEAALALDRNFAESHGGLAVVLVLRKNETAAQEHTERALRLDPHCLSGRYAQALLRGEIKDAADTRRLARRLLGTQPMLFGGMVGDLLPPEEPSSD